MRRLGDGTKVLAFVTVTGLLTGFVGVVFANVRLGEDTTYTAVFEDTTGLETGAEVRAAGVDVGRVEDLSLRDDSTVLVTFSAVDSVPLTTATEVRIRYLNLMGGRYLDLSQRPGEGVALPEDATIPLQRTSPALDLDELFHSFTPLMQGLDPREVNALTSSLIKAFEGEAGGVESLLGNIGRFTNSLADRDRVIGELVHNLDTVLGTMGRRRAEFDELVVNAQRVVSGLAEDRRRIGRSLVRLDTLTRTGTAYLASVRPELHGTIEQTRRIMAALNSELDIVDHYLSVLPGRLRKLGRVGAYGTFYNMYVCGVTFTVTGPDGKPMPGPVWYDEDTTRCRYPKDVPR